MDLKWKLWQLVLVLMIALALVRAAAEAAAPQYALPGCNYTCGDVRIPYPFGIGISSSTQQRCFLESRYSGYCNNSKLYSTIAPETQVFNLSLEGQLVVSFYVSKLCPDEAEANDPILFLGPSYTVSSKENKFITVGCDHLGYINSVYNGSTYSTGCLTRCYGNDPNDTLTKKMIEGNCSGVGCCQVDIPPRMKNVTIEVARFPNSRESIRYCGHSFVAKQGSYVFSTSHITNLPDEEFPLVLDWSVGNETCEAAKRRYDYACMNNSFCDDKDLDYGYRCRCKEGYEGNPYHPDGCVDVNECKTSKHTCISEANCINNNGNYTCFCPEGHSGSGTKEGGCHQNEEITTIVIGLSVGLLALSMGIFWLFFINQRRKLIKLRQKFFHRNGGFILQQHLSTIEESTQTFKVFTEEELKRATNNYDNSLIIGRGGYGTVFKGTLADNRFVAVKKSRVIDQSQIKPFINEVVVLSQINHRNVVKLLGCCLETEVPSLVYEFVNNGTLFEYLHNKKKASIMSWKTRLRIAAEVAGALSYLHSAASVPIIHRDVKSANILLDENYTAKVSDFGASRLVPRDQTELETVVQGTLGYLDPECMLTSQLTEKSDVYSFGVVLVELLTGEKALVFQRPEEKRSTAMYFLSCLEEGCLFEVLEVGILNEENKEEIKEVAVLASKCLSLKGKERPSMKQVAMELEGMRLMDKHPWCREDIYLEETRYLLHGDSSNQQNIGPDSLRELQLEVLGDGR